MAELISVAGVRNRVVALDGPVLELHVRRADAAVNDVGIRALARSVVVDVLLAPLFAVRNSAQSPGGVLLGGQLTLVQPLGRRVRKAEDLLLLNAKNLRNKS